MKGVLDRIEEDRYAVILLEEHNREVILPKDQLPSGSEVHDWFRITMEGDTVTSITLDEKTTQAEEAKTEDMMKKLRAKSKGSKFKRR
ncbi:DUF3006 domain-containing protein [Aquibacillus sediminis]|uniref:DUF3006 domain-containing protein n=1 Tax=Aquibacillus sediminis TaxID=2574734 RepID=UPI001107B731|nr:DUF3006 domain-containing protein [Aquibacillus sediminis]